MPSKQPLQSRQAIRVVGIVVILLVSCFACQQLPFLPITWRYRNVNLVAGEVGRHYANPHWSPDGSKIAFDDGRQVQITKPNGELVASLDANWADWSPDGKQIVFTSNRNGNTQVFIMDEDGTNATQLTKNFAFAGCPRWSPNGKWIAFCGRLTNADATPQLYITSPYGKDLARLTNPPLSMNLYFDWSLDSAQIVFSANKPIAELSPSLGLEQHLFVMNADGTDLKQIDNGDAASYYPIWITDRRILFGYSEDVRSTLNLPNGIYMMNVDGTDRQLVLTDSCLQPNWSRVRNEIAFVCGFWGPSNPHLYIYRMGMQDFLR